MCLLAGNLVSKISPVIQNQNNSYLYNSSPPAVSIVQQEEKEPEVIVETVIETRIVNFSQGKRELTDDERALAEQIVACEAGADSLEGQMAVAQCLYDSAVLDGLTIQQVFKKYGYSSLYNRKVTAENELAVSMVFDYGAKISDKPIQWFVTPAAAPSSWHERGATFAGQFGAHRFYYDAKLVVDDAE
jgi:spore germination cell wall hydrolase CwlJ-like protein